MKPRLSWSAALLVSEGCAFLFAIVYVVAMTLGFPPTDAAFGTAAFVDPMVFPIMAVVAAISGLLISPAMYHTLKNRSLSRCLPIIIGITVAFIAFITPLNRVVGFFGSFGAFIAALLLCSYVAPERRPNGQCQYCGYDLTGNESGVCPECGTAA